MALRSAVPVSLAGQPRTHHAHEGVAIAPRGWHCASSRAHTRLDCPVPSPTWGTPAVAAIARPHRGLGDRAETGGVDGGLSAWGISDLFLVPVPHAAGRRKSAPTAPWGSFRRYRFPEADQRCGARIRRCRSGGILSASRWCLSIAPLPAVRRYASRLIPTALAAGAIWRPLPDMPGVSAPAGRWVSSTVSPAPFSGMQTTGASPPLIRRTVGHGATQLTNLNSV